MTADFNTEDLSEFECFKHADTVQHNKRLISFPRDRSAIDNIVFPKAFELKNCDVYKATHSDHRHMWAEFEWTVE